MLVENENTGGGFLWSGVVSGHHRYSTGKKWAGKGMGSCDRELSSRTTNGPDTQLIVREVELRYQRVMSSQTKIYFCPGKNLCTNREGRLGAADS